MTTATQSIPWREWTKTLPVGVGALPAGEMKLFGKRYFHRQPDTNKIYTWGFGAGADSGPPDCGPDATAVYDEAADEWSCQATPGPKPKPGEQGGGGQTRPPIVEACPPGQVRNAQGQCVAGGGGPGPGPGPGPTPSSTTPSEGTNWAPWFIGGAVVLGGGIILYAIMRKPKSKEIHRAAEEESYEARKHAHYAMRLRAAAHRRAHEEARETRMMKRRAA